MTKSKEEIIEEMQQVVAQMVIDDIEENPDIANEYFDCDCCGQNKCLAGSIQYSDYRLCNDCVLLAETGFALDKFVLWRLYANNGAEIKAEPPIRCKNVNAILSAPFFQSFGVGYFNKKSAADFLIIAEDVGPQAQFPNLQFLLSKTFISKSLIFSSILKISSSFSKDVL